MAPSSSPSPTTSVQVALRIRPPTTQDSTSIPARFQRSVIHATSSTLVTVEASSSTPASSGASATSSVVSSGSTAKKQQFSFDQVHSPPTTQYELFTSTAKPLISRFVEGFNCTILAYGQTSSGKTFTMTGIDLDADPSDPNNGMGIIPRAVSNIFSRAKQLKDERGGAWNYSVKGSFIEIYNEDLIDLLSLDDVAGGRREVQIREDKDGTIIWGGLREVNVRNSSEVMTLIRKGTSIRRTNETDMNAQSSRSHAIFSLTLTQKKYTGSGLPPRSSSPLPPGGRSPSRLARPGSLYSNGPNGPRVASPTNGRPSTPSFASAMGRGGGLRPSSALGHLADRSIGSVAASEDDPGEWVTIVSKFHFVDLAGSERLKRTAAAGERIKEGISINSGLLALGNVISALGDPSRAKSHTATHVPYRDSKLTRLLQDSLGGNAHTLMIACVSPAEWNAGETINTLKYANRARNIKNRAIVNEKEDGWDDVEWLQGTVSRLRKELKIIKDGGPVIGPSNPPEVLEGAGKKVLAQMTELQNNYEDLREKFVERTEELTRLRRELGERHRGSTSGSVGGTAKYEEIVGPVIEEYEKTIAAMEAELNLNRAALRHTNEMVEEKEDELSVITERHAATELYVEELRNRVAKLTEREASTEAYVRDLEEKMKNYDESSITSSESMTDLRREIARFKDAESYSGKYINELEARLARSDESVLALQQSVERLETECERRRDQVELLQSRLEMLREDGESWRSDLEERERKVKILEEKMEEWERKKKDAGDTRVRLGSVVGEVASARRSLEIDLAGGSPTSIDTLTPFPSDGTPAAEPESFIEGQLLALQQTHTATLADLSSVTSKYRDALREISDLAAQIQEAKLSNPSIAESNSEELSAVDKPHDIPPFRRRLTSPRTRDLNEAQYNSSGRRLFFRQAASAESLHSRSLSQSQSLSQELSSAHSRKASFSSHGSSSHSPSNSHSHNGSLASRPNLSISLPSSSPVGHANERSVSSLEKEIMRLQEVLKEREVEISVLESSLKESREDQTAVASPVPEHLEAPLVNGKMPLSDTLSPQTLNQFDHIRKSMENGNGHVGDGGSERNGSSVFSETDESLERLNELMLSMAQKESYHREVVDDLNTQLTQVRRQLDDLTALSRDQAVNMSNEIEGLRGKHHDDLITLQEVQQREVELVESLKRAEINHTSALERLRTEHVEALETQCLEVDALLARMKAEHSTSTAALRDELAAASAALDKSQQDHEEAFGKLKTEHAEELHRRLQEVQDTLNRAHQESINAILGDHAETLKQKEAEANVVLQTTEEEYYNALTKVRGDHAETLKKYAAEASATLQRLREEHAGELRLAEIAREGSLSESESSQALALQSLQEEYSTAIARKEASFVEAIQSLKTDHARSLQTKDEDYALQINRIRSEHEGVLAKLKEEWRVESERLKATLAAVTASSKALEESDIAMRALNEQQAALLQKVEREHEEDLSRLKAAHESGLRDALSESEKKQFALAQHHEEENTKINSQHEKEVADVNATLKAVQEDHQRSLEVMRTHNQSLLTEEHDRLAVNMETLKRQHIVELEALRRDQELLVLDQEKRKRGHLAEVETLRKEQDLLVQKLEGGKQSFSQEMDALRQDRDLLTQQLEETKQSHSAQIESLHTSRDSLARELETHKAKAEESILLIQKSHAQSLQQKASDVESIEQKLSGVNGERNELQALVTKLQAELEKTQSEQSQLVQEASKRESLIDELERHRSLIAEMHESLQKVKDEKDTIQMEKNRSDSLVRELQAQASRSSPPPHARAAPDRNMSYTRATGLPAMKLPPPTPPPTVPPPPAPRSMVINGDAGFSSSSQTSSGVTSSGSVRESQPESPSSSIGDTPFTGQGGVGSTVDSKIPAQLEKQAKQLDEQEAMIKTLNKQLTHCESDLQTHIDLVNTLETSLGDSEKNLRKARMHATELARERDTLNTKLEALRNELTEAKREVVTVRRSIVEEKQSLEQRLDEERRAKERARHQLDSRVDQLQKRKSKFACL